MANVKLLHRPRVSRSCALIGIRRRLHCERRDVSSIWMLTVSIRRCATENADDDERFEGPDDADGITQDNFLVPLLFCFVEGLRKSVVVSPCEELLRPVESSRL